MSLPPERINIKRRRQDDPVEALLLEQVPGRNKKRRATDFVFKRLRAHEIDHVPHILKPADQASGVRQAKQRSASQSDNSGIPQIRTTLPGDEVNDIKALKAAIKSRVAGAGAAGLSKNHQLGPPETAAPSQTPTIKVPTNARRFHLSREQDLLRPSKLHGGVRKSVHRPKINLAIFVEKGLSRKDQHTQSAHKIHPIDRIVEVKTSDSLDEAVFNVSDLAEPQKQKVTKHTFVQPFVKPATTGAKTGHTINTHPATWDFDSDQLASELAAFAFELDPTGDNAPPALHPKAELNVARSNSATEDEYVYETYIRLPHNAAIQTEIEQNSLTMNIGVLIIAQEDEELWEAYAESDGDDEWDEEDADSNAEDNPANDYPENEVSSDDEFGLGSYNHRRNASDNEEYDFDRDE